MAKRVMDSSAGDGSQIEIELKDPRLAAFLAWLIPGAGHLYQGRTGKGLLFMICILGTFFYGMYIGSGRVVFASTADFFPKGIAVQGGAPVRGRWLEFVTDRWQYVCQLGVGLPAMPALVQRSRIRNHKAPLFGSDLMRPPYNAIYLPPPAETDLYFKSIDQTDANNTVVHPDELSKWNYDYGENFDIGTVFTVIAGLLNLLVVFDAYSGPLVIAPHESSAQTSSNKKE